MNGERRKLVVDKKAPKLQHNGDDLDLGIVPRSEIRRGDHRDGDRHRLTDETINARHKGKTGQVDLINLSGGGAMIRPGFPLQLWDRLELELGEGAMIEAVVRWIKDDCCGVEFAQETQIDCDPQQRARLLLQVIRRSFPDSDVEIALPDSPDHPEPIEEEDEELGARNELRHPLVWKGDILYSFDTNPVRLRNVSSGGALVDVSISYPVGAEVMLDLGEAGQYSATVAWARGDQAGLRFHDTFDVDCLADARAELASHHWIKPDFLNRDGDEVAEWESEWSKGSIDDLKTRLEGFLKH